MHETRLQPIIVFFQQILHITLQSDSPTTMSKALMVTLHPLNRDTIMQHAFTHNETKTHANK